jgi:hypothetical protein
MRTLCASPRACWKTKEVYVGVVSLVEDNPLGGQAICFFRIIYASIHHFGVRMGKTR